MSNIELLNASITGWLTELYEDSLDPKPDYSLDGQTVSRAAWREGLMRMVKEAQELATMLDPYELHSVLQG